MADTVVSVLPSLTKLVEVVIVTSPSMYKAKLTIMVLTLDTG